MKNKEKVKKNTTHSSVSQYPPCLRQHSPPQVSQFRVSVCLFKKLRGALNPQKSPMMMMRRRIMMMRRMMRIMRIMMLMMRMIMMMMMRRRRIMMMR